MRAIVEVGVITMLTTVGCASAGTTAQGAERDFSGFAQRGNPSLRIGPARVVGPGVHPALPLETAKASRVELDGGRFVVCWTRGSIEEGRRALAQAFKADGTPMGAPVVISPPDVDVVQSPKAVTTDGQHVIATFTVTTDGAMELLAVPIEAGRYHVSGERTALR